jgi:fructose-1,6-bisphosphatase/inositol monophosphatase family enzyme
LYDNKFRYYALVGLQSNISELTSFAQGLLKPALRELSAGYSELVAKLQANSELEQLVKTEGIHSVIAGDHPSIASLQKQNKEFVTSAEKRAEQIMRDLVSATYPNHTQTGEELGNTEGDKWLWVFDPVDGTSAMIRTAIAQAYRIQFPAPLPAFGVTIAVIHNDTAVIGIVGELRPNSSGLDMPNIWVGVAGEPTTRNEKPVIDSRQRTFADAILACTVPEVMFTTRESWGGFQALLEKTATFTPDQNCIGYMRLVDGDIDIVIEGDLTLPDAAALIPILHGAGITVTDHIGQPINFDADARAGEYRLLAAPPSLHSAALALLQAGVPDDKNQFTNQGSISQGYAQKFVTKDSSNG